VDLERALAIARLLRWLGPWTPDHARPTDTLRRTHAVAGRFDAWVYRASREPIGALLVLPGLHYLGPADPRLDRFLAILADAGLLVLCPFLPELRSLGVGPAVVDDSLAAFDALSSLPDLPRGVRPGVFSISFGSYPAIHVAASRDVGHVLLFGGYASFDDAIRFSLEGNPDRPHDPLNRPIVFLVLFDHLDGLPRDPARLRRAWVEYVRRTWGKPEMKQRDAHERVARAIAARLSEDARELFLIGTGVVEGGPARIERALERGRADLAHLDPRSACRAITAPVTIVHGRDDDVIPHTHAAMLAEDIPHARTLLTGLYAHTGRGALDPHALAGEASALAGILSAMIDAGRS
jgi:pimeloyl-ACP methyl ester carboxylesterase